MSRLWRWILPCYAFALPMTMAGWVIAILAYRASSWAWHDGLLTCIAATGPDGTRIWGKPNAQTLGWIQIYDSEGSRGHADLRVHETVHVVQAFVGGLVGLVLTPVVFLLIGWPFWLGVILGGFAGSLGFAVLYGILFLYLLLRDRTGWYNAYLANPFEIQAYSIQDRYIAGELPRAWGV